MFYEGVSLCDADNAGEHSRLDQCCSLLPVSGFFQQYPHPCVITGCGGNPAAVQRDTALLTECVGNATFATIKGGAHFVIATYADQA